MALTDLQNEFVSKYCSLLRKGGMNVSVDRNKETISLDEYFTMWPGNHGPEIAERQSGTFTNASRTLVGVGIDLEYPNEEGSSIKCKPVKLSDTILTNIKEVVVRNLKDEVAKAEKAKSLLAKLEPVAERKPAALAHSPKPLSPNSLVFTSDQFSRTV